MLSNISQRLLSMLRNQEKALMSSQMMLWRNT